MKKIVFLFLVALVFSVSKIGAYPLDVPIYKSTVVVSGVTLMACRISSSPVVFVDYVTLSTGSVGQTLDMYDSTHSTAQAVRGWTGFPTSVITSNISLGIETSTGAFACISAEAAQVSKVRLRYYIKTRR